MTAPASTSRMPDALPRRGYLLWVVLVIFIALTFASLRGEWRGFFSLESVTSMLNLFGEFFPPEHSSAFLIKLLWATLETLAISFLGTLLAIGMGLALAVPAANYWGPGWRLAARFNLNVLRAIPELVWAALLVIAAGLGPFPGTLALALHTTGVLGRLMAEALENAPAEPYLALRRNGTAPLPAFLYGTIPVVLPQLVSYTLYRWENNIRAAAILGIVGGGGLGQILYYHMGLFQFRESGSVLIAMLLLVGLVDYCSDAVRQRLLR